MPLIKVLWLSVRLIPQVAKENAYSVIHFYSIYRLHGQTDRHPKMPSLFTPYTLSAGLNKFPAFHSKILGECYRYKNAYGVGEIYH